MPSPEDDENISNTFLARWIEREIVFVEARINWLFWNNISSNKQSSWAVSIKLGCLFFFLFHH